MTFFAIPTAQTIRQHSRLNLEQVWKAFESTTPLDAEIVVRRDAKVALVETKLLQVVSPAGWVAAPADDLSRRNSLASSWVEALTLASLYGSSGQLNARYLERANEYRAEAGEYEAALLAELDAVDGDIDTGQAVPNSAGGQVKAVW